jgi:hypothetical protein
LHIYSLAFFNNYKLRIDFYFLFKMTWMFNLNIWTI